MKPFIRILALLFCALPSALGQGLPDLGDVSQSELSPQTERRLGELGIPLHHTGEAPTQLRKEDLARAWLGGWGLRP